MQRFYGSVDWLNIPFKLLNAYAVMLPVVQAEETLQSVNVFACGSGNLQPGIQKKIFRDLQRQMKVVKEKETRPPVNYAALSMIMPVVDMRGNGNG